MKQISQFLRDMFSEQSNISSMRVMSMIALLVSSYLAIYGIDSKADLNALAVLCSVFLGAAFGGKVAQKFAETKPDKEEK